MNAEIGVDPVPVRFFISYASSDELIAQALCDELKTIDERRVECFLDKRSILSGVRWKERLTDALKNADWLVCIYTGEQSEFCGYEIGVFAEANTLGESQGRLVCLHDVDELKLPAVFQPYQNRYIVYPPDPKPGSAPVDEENFYLDQPLAQFFDDVYRYKALYVASTGADVERQRKKRVDQTRSITKKFEESGGADVLSNTAVPLGVEIEIARQETRDLCEIPDDAIVRGTYESLKLFGVLPPAHLDRWPETTWKELRDTAATRYNAWPLWMQQLGRDMINVANCQTIDGVEATFADKDQRVFRTILARHIKYKNGGHKFEVLFVQTLPRQFLGKAHTSMILAGVVIASRFRFAYLEEPDTIERRFSASLSDEEFSAVCWQLRYDLERMADEAREFGLLDTDVFIKAFGDGNRALAESWLIQSAKLKTELLEALPAPESYVNTDLRARARAAVGRYLNAIEIVNGQFLVKALEILQKEVRQQVGHSPRPGW